MADQLAGLFDVSDEHNPNSKPNAVDAEEFASVVKTDTAIVENAGCLDTSRLGEKERDAALGDFREILRTRTGRHLLRDILEDPNGDRVIMEQLQAGSSPNTKSLSMPDSLRRDSDEQLPGADSLLGYHPGQEHPFGGEGDAPDWYPIPSHVVLFRELLHAEHHQSGTAAHNTDGKRHNHDEENLTTGTHDTLEPYLNENRYRAERRELGDDLPEQEWYFKP